MTDDGGRDIEAVRGIFRCLFDRGNLG